jgi:SAM-dependent methyltransferase
MALHLLQSLSASARVPFNAIRMVTRRNAPASVPQRFWARQGGQAWVERYWDDYRSPRRDMIVEAIRENFGTPKSVLDVGCNAGPNLRRMFEEFPACVLSGFDVNAEAIEYARSRFTQMGSKAELWIGTFDDELSRLPADTFDLVISSFALAYVPPRDMPRILADCVRIAQRGLVLAEPQPFDAKRPEGVLSGTPDWCHDYRRLLEEIGVTRVETADAPDPGHPWSGLVVAFR